MIEDNTEHFDFYRLLVLLGRGSDTWKQMNYEVWVGALFAFFEGATVFGMERDSRNSCDR